MTINMRKVSLTPPRLNNKTNDSKDDEPISESLCHFLILKYYFRTDFNLRPLEEKLKRQLKLRKHESAIK